MERTHFGQHDNDCFGCKVQGISFAFPWGGREVFKGPTNRERTEQMLTEARSNGIEPEPLTRWV